MRKCGNLAQKGTLRCHKAGRQAGRPHAGAEARVLLSQGLNRAQRANRCTRAANSVKSFVHLSYEQAPAAQAAGRGCPMGPTKNRLHCRFPPNQKSPSNETVFPPSTTNPTLIVPPVASKWWACRNGAVGIRHRHCTPAACTKHRRIQLRSGKPTKPRRKTHDISATEANRGIDAVLFALAQRGRYFIC